MDILLLTIQQPECIDMNRKKEVNMNRLEIYNPEKTYLYPNAMVATPEAIQAEYTMVNHFKTVVYTDLSRKIFSQIEEYDSMRLRLGIDESLGEEEALLTMENIVNAPPPEPTLSSEEIIASQLMLQNLLAMQDI